MKHKNSGFLARHLGSDQFTDRQVIGMLIPLILDQLFIYAIALLTTSMISSSGQDSVTAVSLVTPVNMLITAVELALCAGGAVVIAQYKGHGDYEKVQEAIGQTVWFSMGTSIVTGLTVCFSAGALVELLFGAAEESVKQKAELYLAGMAINLIVQAVRNGVSAGLRGVGDNKSNLYASMLMNVSYFIFSFVFLNLLHMDIPGTLLAYFLARILGLLYSLYCLFWKRGSLVHIRLRQMLIPKNEYIKAIWRLGLPFSAEDICFNGGTILVSSYMVLLGTTSVAAHAIANSVLNTLFAPITAVGVLATTIIGQCVGAGRRDLARWYGKKLVLLGYAMAVLSVLVMAPLLPWIMSLYHPEPAAQELVWKLLLIGMGGLLTMLPSSLVMPYTLRAAGDAYYSTAVSLTTMWGIRVGLGYFVSVSLHIGIMGIWGCMVLEWLVRSILYGMRYRGKRWLSKKSVIEAES